MALRESTKLSLLQALKDVGAAEEVTENLEAVEGLSNAELTALDGVTPGTAAANKAVVLGAAKELATLGWLSVAGLNYTTGAVTATAA
jgi:hypothetical protein